MAHEFNGESIWAPMAGLQARASKPVWFDEVSEGLDILAAVIEFGGLGENDRDLARDCIQIASRAAIEDNQQTIVTALRNLSAVLEEDPEGVWEADTVWKAIAQCALALADN